jgi:hypothetical protein
MPLIALCVLFQEDNINTITYIHVPFQQNNVNATIANIPLLTFYACMCIIYCQCLFVNA